MREAIHPHYPGARVSCACGNTFVTRSVRGDFQVDVCAKCHPFYTGTMKLIDTAGRVDRFRKRYETKVKPGAAAAATAAAGTAATAPAAPPAVVIPETPAPVEAPAVEPTPDEKPQA